LPNERVTVTLVKFSELRKKTKVKFSVADGRYIVAKLNQVPEFSKKVFSIIQDKNEVTVVAEEGLKLPSVSEERFFKLITFAVTLPFNLTGFLSHVSVLLARKGIPILVLSSFSTDHLLIKEEDFERAVEALKEDGMQRE
jgi:hypothetical protein